MIENLSEWITQKDASNFTGRSLKSVCQLVRRNRVRSKEIFGKRLVHCQDILTYKPIKSGRPKKEKVF